MPSLYHPLFKVLSPIISFNPHTNLGGSHYHRWGNLPKVPKLSVSCIRAQRGRTAPLYFPTDLLQTCSFELLKRQQGMASAVPLLWRERKRILCSSHTQFYNVLSCQHLCKPWEQCSNCKLGSHSFFFFNFHTSFLFYYEIHKLGDFTILKGWDGSEIWQSSSFPKKHLVSN